MSSNKRVTVKQLCDKHNVGKTTLHYWIKTGHLAEALVESELANSRQYIFDEAIADKMLIELLASKQRQPLVDLKNTPLVANSEKEIEKIEQAIKSQGPTITQSKAVKEAYKAKLYQLEYEEKTKKLVNRHKIRSLFTTTAKIIRNDLLAIPGRVAAEVSNMTDSREIEKLITSEILGSLKNLQNVEI